MRNLSRWLVLLGVFALALIEGCAAPTSTAAGSGESSLLYSGEKRLKNIRKLTEGGTNAEAYWSFDGSHLSYQHKGPGIECDQIFTMRADGSEKTLISGNRGRTTCSYYFPNGERVLYSSTADYDPKCPKNPDMSHGYVWPIYPTYQFFSSKPDGSDPIPLEPGAPKAYNAEMTVCKDGSVVFTSDRDGDLDLYTAKLDPLGTIRDVRRVTTGLGYDGGAFFSPDCSKLVWRASRPRSAKEASEYKALLKQHLVRPTQLEIWVGNADGSHAKQVTRLGSASFAPYFTPDGEHILFASNPRDPHGRAFDIYRIRVDGTRLERVTYSNTFESFPMFSPDGKSLAFSSNRNAKAPHDTNVFVADWVETPEPSISLDDSDPANRFMALVETLSAPGMEGRAPGTQGFKAAAEVVKERMKKIGLRPFFDVFKKAEKGQGYLQEVQIGNASSQNVIGAWGNGCGTGVHPILIGAHLDHLGNGTDGSLEPTKSGIHPGADDNASGVAGMLEAARIIVGTAQSEDRSCYVFAAFTGEETGIYGSNQMAKMMKDAQILPKAMLNLDMVGRLENNKLTVFGTASGKEWPKWVEEECASRALTCPGGGDGYGPSDHMSFYVAKVPVLHFFTGPHVDYHRTTDVASKVNATGGVQAAEAVAAVALRAGKPGASIHYIKASGTPTMGLVGRPGKKGHGASLGTIPDYSALSSPHGPAGGGMPGGGVKLAGVRPGSPADQAGVKEGDILFSIEGRKIMNLQDFMEILTDLIPGQKIALVVKRGTDFVQLTATVGKHESHESSGDKK